jgi:hypothetical protein
MDRVGGFGDLVALEADAARYDDVLIAMAAEAEARRIADQEARRNG